VSVSRGHGHNAFVLTDAPTDTIPAPAPDWHTLSQDVICPLCAYNLRGLAEPRCPECGYVFQWNEVLNPHIIRHPWLFEHNPRRPIRSFFRTQFENLRPRRFWRTVRATHEPRRVRLLCYWMISVLLVLIMPVGMVVREAYQVSNEISSERNQTARLLKARGNEIQLRRVINGWGSVDAYLDSRYPPILSARYAGLVWETMIDPLRSHRSLQYRAVVTAPALLTMIVWPWATFITLMIFLVSMRRANIKLVHVLRCVLYSCDALWLGAILVAAMPDSYLLPEFLRHPARAVGDEGLLQLLVGLLFALLVGYRLSAAYALYLKFPHAGRVVMASQVIVFLTLLVLVLN
jgi:rubredoxin